MTTVLFIALEFPPIQVAGSFRALRFATHLPKHGILPVVVSFNPAQFADSPTHKVNPAFAREIPGDTPIYFIDLSAIETGRPPMHPGQASQFRGTHCSTFAELFARVATDYDIDLVWATCPPFNVDRLAVAAKQHFRRPLVIDMRDAWSQWGSRPFRTLLHYRHILRRERAMLGAADAVTCVTPQLVDMERRLTRKPREQFECIPNAYDGDCLPRGEVKLTPGEATYRVAYVGQFYFNNLHETSDGIIPWYRKMPHRWLHYHATSQRWIYRTPYFFFRAWQTLRERYPELKRRFEFHYVGDAPSWLPKMAEAFKLTEQCTWHGFLGKVETQAFLNDCEAMLSTSIKVENGEDYCIASKTFDYIATRKPVLAFVCPGAQRDFLANANIAMLFDPDDTAQCVEQLRSLVENGFRREIDHSYLERYSSQSTTGQLADLVRRVVGGQGGRA